MIKLNTKRLELIPVTTTLCYADLHSHKQLSAHLYAQVPDSWPPALLTHDTLKEFIELLTASEGSRLHAYYWVRTGHTPDERLLIGSGGFVEDEWGTLELGYSVLDEFQRLGYATEAVDELLKWARSKSGVTCIKACTFPSLIGSIRVLEKSGFVREGNGSEEGSIAYRLII